MTMARRRKRREKPLKHPDRCPHLHCWSAESGLICKACRLYVRLVEGDDGDPRLTALFPNP
jgi:hypothetical protein